MKRKRIFHLNTMLIYGVRELAPAFIAAASRRIQQRYDNHITLYAYVACNDNGSCMAGTAANSRAKSGGKPPHSIKRITPRFLSVIIATLCILMSVFCIPARALESGSYRLLSVSVSENLILVSRIPDQKKFLLDTTDAKVTINDNPAEFSDITSFTVIKIQMDLSKKKRKGINVDGRVHEIAISNPVEK